MTDPAAAPRAPGLEPVRTTAVRRLGWLLSGAALLLLSNGRWIFPPAAWLAPAAWLGYLERSRTWPGIAGAFGVYLPVQFVVWWGIIPAPGVLYFVAAGLYALAYFVPIALHRLIAPRITGFAATLVFPLAAVSVEFVFQRWITPYGSWAAPAYTQADYPALLQLATLTGVAGLSFLMAWFASVVVWITRPGRPARERQRAAAVWAVATLAVLTFGHVRLEESRPAIDPVRVAGLVPSAELARELEKALAPFRLGALEPSALSELEAIADRLNADLFARTRREARAGARLVAWSETAGRVLGSGERGLLERAGRVALEEEVYVIVAYGVFEPGAEPPFQNKLVAIDRVGNVVWEYRKARPIFGAESTLIEAGAGIIRRLETPFGTVGAVICHDLDFPTLLRQASREGVGLVVGPSADWQRIAALHADMARVRAIEGGFALLRPTSGGRSIATDARGRMLARVEPTEDAIVASVIPRASATVYGVVGDLFAWLCLAGFVAMIFSAVRRLAARPADDHEPGS